MVAILENPEDEVAVIHEDSGLVLCIACSKDWCDKHKYMLQHLSFTRIIARNCGIHAKCDRCHGTFLTTEF